MLGTQKFAKILSYNKTPNDSRDLDFVKECAIPSGAAIKFIKPKINDLNMNTMVSIHEVSLRLYPNQALLIR